MRLKEKFEYFLSQWSIEKAKSFKANPIADYFRAELRLEVESFIKDYNGALKVVASVGAGQWATVPWISILDPRITTSTQEGVYPVYLVCGDGSGVYFSLMQGVTKLEEEHGKSAALDIINREKAHILERWPQLLSWGKGEMDLKSTLSLPRSYEKANIVAKYYATDSFPSDEALATDLAELLTFYEEIAASMSNVTPAYKESTENMIQTTHIYKPFLILAGISGTGKTRFVRQQAMATGSLSENYCLTPVRPDWHEPSDLLGYMSRLSGQAEYVSTDVLMFIAKAWRAVVDHGLSVQVDSHTGRLVVQGQRASLAAVVPYWLCLDEMNLAPVEQYFADYLSVLETQEWRWQGDGFSYTSDALLNAEVIRTVDNTDKLRADLGFQAPAYDALWEQFCQYGMGLPFNLIVAGTVNMDETTHGFSRKVLDRALTLDFGEFFPNNFDEFFEPSTRAKALTYPTWSATTLEALSTTIDTDGQRSNAFLKSVNAVLAGTTFELAFRALNELYLAVISVQPQDEASLYAVWDDFLMSKVLPRIEGDADKLGGTTPLLTRLITVLEMQLAPIWGTATEEAKRPDLYRESLRRDEDDTASLEVVCRSRQKLSWMRERLNMVGFTSFWP